ncbi:MAG: transposase [Verrucomicrobia bacterium]|nr:transposase [Verrucomicrobiota bacterium]
MSTQKSKDDSLHLHKFATEAPASGEGLHDMGQTEFIKRTAAETVQEDASLAAQHTAEFGLPLKEMLGVIAYCYVKGVFNSTDIAALLKSDPALRAKFGRDLPDGNTVRRFRRKFAGEIEDVLEDVFRMFPKGADAGAIKTEFVHRQAADLLHDVAWTDSGAAGLPPRPPSAS